MPRHHKIIDLLSDEHFAEFQSLIAKRGATMDGAFKWAVGKGYAISRGAVAGYVKSFRSRPLFTMSMDLGHVSEADTRAKLIEWIQGIDGDRPILMSIMAAALRNAEPVKLPARGGKPR